MEEGGGDAQIPLSEIISSTITKFDFKIWSENIGSERKKLAVLDKILYYCKNLPFLNKFKFLDHF